MKRPPRELGSKRYYTCGEAAKIVGVTANTLRYWERQFKSLKPKRSRTSGERKDRLYDSVALTVALRIKELLYLRGFTYAGVKWELGESADEPYGRESHGESTKPGGKGT
jgi:DNA-binding transcriptional MerR regulator